jgi:hypothetical protein
VFTPGHSSSFTVVITPILRSSTTPKYLLRHSLAVERVCLITY